MAAARRRAARPLRRPAAGQPRPGRRRLPDAHRDPRPPASRAVPRARRRRRRRRAPGAAGARHAGLRRRRGTATGCACTRWRATCCAQRFAAAAGGRAGRAARARRRVAGRARACSRRPRGTRWPPGQRETAYDLAERSLYESLMAHGRQGAVLDWLARLPADELDRRPRLLLAAAWSLALSERHEEAEPTGRAHPGAARRSTTPLRCECALILSGAAVFADDPDRFAELHDPWAECAAAARPAAAAGARQPHGVPHPARRRAGAGAAAPAAGAARRLRRGAPATSTAGATSSSRLTYLWEGQVLLAENLLRPTLAARRGRPRPAQPVRLHAGGAAGRRGLGARPARRGRVRCWPTGSTCWSAAACPRPCCSAIAPLARIAVAEGAEHRALELLGALDAVGRRAQPAAAAHRQPGRPGAPARAALPRRDLPRPVRAHRRAAGRPGAAAGPPVAAQRRRCCASWRTATRRSRRRTGAARSSRWRGPTRWRAGLQAGPAAHRAAGPARLRARPLRREGACRCCARRSTWRGTYGLLRVVRRRPPGARRLGARGARRRDAPAAGAAGRRRPRRAQRAAPREPRRGPRRPRAWRSRRRSARCWSCWRATSPTRRSALAMQVGRRDDQVAHEEPVRQARRRHAQAGRSPRPHPGSARNRAPEAGPPPPSAMGGSGAPPLPNLASSTTAASRRPATTRRHEPMTIRRTRRARRRRAPRRSRARSRSSRSPARSAPSCPT